MPLVGVWVHRLEEKKGLVLLLLLLPCWCSCSSITTTSYIFVVCVFCRVFIFSGGEGVLNWGGVSLFSPCLLFYCPLF